MCFIFIFCFKWFFFFNAIHRSRYIFFSIRSHRRIVSMFFSLSLSLCTYFFSIYYRPWDSSVKERKKRRESARERSIGFIMNFARFHVDELFIRCSFLCVRMYMYIYTHIHIYIYILFFRSLYYIGDFSFTHVIYLYSLKIRFIHRGERADEHRGCEEKKMPIRSEQDETTGRLFSWWWPVETMTPVMTMTMMGGRCEVIVGVQCSTWIARCSRSSMNGWARKWGNRIWLIYIYVFYNITVCVLCQLFDYFIFFYLFSVFDWCFFHVHSSTFS